MTHLLCQANALKIPLADKSIQCCVTSPPYWGLRDYGVDGQLGLESTPDEFVANMTAVFREVKRVLRDDGALWLNIGDSYSGGKTGRADSGGNGRFGGPEISPTQRPVLPGMKPKDLVGIPWRLAFALQADGWYLRSDIIWHKPNPMPESVTDRPTKSHEYLFLLSKSERYYFDSEAVRENASNPVGDMVLTGDQAKNRVLGKISSTSKMGANYGPPNRNIRSVWTIPTESYPGSHFATFPRRLVEPCIKAGTSERGQCPVCGSPWERVLEKNRVATRPGNVSKIYTEADMVLHPESPYQKHNGDTCGNRDPGRHCTVSATVGWEPTCNHNVDPTPCVVLDPFCGSGTTGVVALALGRQFVGLDLSREYLGLAANRICRPHAPIQRPGRPEAYPLFDAS